MRLSLFQRFLMGIIAFFLILLILLFGLKENPLLPSYNMIGYDFISSVKYYFIDKPTKTIMDFLNSYAKYETTTRELELLLDEIEKVANLKENFMELKKENEELKLLLDLKNTGSEYDTKTANVIGRNVEGWHNYLTIDLGSVDGISVNEAVINQDGLIGKVYQVYESTSLVKLITSEDGLNKISLKIAQDKSVEAILDHYDVTNQCFILRVIDDNTDILVDSKVVTSSMGGVYPNGLLVGSVQSVEDSNYQLGKVVYVTPSADFRSINVVNVIKRKIDEVVLP